MRSSRLFVLFAAAAFSFSACNCGKTGTLETFGILSVDPTSLEFGPVTEFTEKTMKLSLENTGRGALTLSVALEGSSEFRMGTAPSELASGAKVELDVTFAPMGAGEDTAEIVITSDEPDRAPVRVTLHGGAIWPQLQFEPDPLPFAPAASALVTKQAVLRNVGGATLHINGIGVNPSGSPDFSVTPPPLPLYLVPDASVSVSVAYARSLNTAEGILQVVSDEPTDGGLDRQLRLLPDPARVCGDGLDNDNDGLIDFPDDIGCTSTEDGDEYNPPECVSGGTQPCGSTTGSCRAGTRVCANSIWGGCDGGVRPMTETCNGFDDDCNGMSDENLSELCLINGCSGARACVPNSGTDGGQFTACIPISSMPEICNGIDDNCNGTADEGVVQTCMVNGCLGVRICVPGSDGGFTSCMPTNPLPETCNGMDDDCNGMVDDLPDLACGIGPCRRLAAACVDGGVGSCTPGMPGTESCNGVDDDCNGTPDDGVPALSCGVGACSVSAPACLMDGGMNVCVPAPPSMETCNNIDDNCNGTRDEQADGGPIRQACYTGPAPTRNIGLCRDGNASCVSGSFGSCVGEVTPVSEVCDDLDQDCDGFRDEQTDGGPLRQACYTGPAPTRSIGRCRDGSQTCMTGAYGACTGDILPTTETCNGIDDNCNTFLDEQTDGGVITQTCYTGPGGTAGVGRCRSGTQTCTSGAFGTCTGQVLPAASETCANMIDDNCNNQVDEACDGGPCDTTGNWRVNGSPIAYTCAFGLVSISITQFNIANNIPAAGQMRWLPQFTWSPGAGLPLVGTLSSCPSGTVNVSVVYPGSCTETYGVTGNFTGPDSFSGTMTMGFTGSCFGCTGRSIPFTLVRP
ncbi:MAG: choice-of-anchor D domain-containing protein [Archangium sp.]|nr:choice-of-anchor D domain-containing protein [Archangium sp.]